MMVWTASAAQACFDLSNRLCAARAKGFTAMIYADEHRARAVAAWLNSRPGSYESRAVLTEHGWTVRTEGYA